MSRLRAAGLFCLVHLVVVALGVALWALNLHGPFVPWWTPLWIGAVVGVWTMPLTAFWSYFIGPALLRPRRSAAPAVPSS